MLSFYASFINNPRGSLITANLLVTVLKKNEHDYYNLLYLCMGELWQLKSIFGAH